MNFPRRTFLGMAGGLVLAPAAFSQTARTVPIELANGKIFVPTIINGQPVQAMLDSGSAPNGIDPSFADRAHVVAKGRRVTMRGVQHTLRGRYAQAQISVAGFEIQQAPVLVLDYGDLSATVGRPIEAALGGDFFRRFVIELDFVAKTLRLHPRDSFVAPPAPAVLAPLRPVMGLMTTTLSVGGESVDAIVDTGSDPPLIVSPAPAGRLQLLRSKTVSTAPLGGVGGASIARITTAPQVVLGGAAFDDVPVQAPPRSLGVDANLGLGLLSRFHLWFDFGGQRMWLSPNGESTPFRRDLLGFYGRVDDDEIRITHVAPGSPAATAGFRAGDVVMLINGEPAVAANQALKDAPQGTALTFTLANGATRSLTLTRYY